MSITRALQERLDGPVTISRKSEFSWAQMNSNKFKRAQLKWKSLHFLKLFDSRIRPSMKEEISSRWSADLFERANFSVWVERTFAVLDGERWSARARNRTSLYYLFIIFLFFKSSGYTRSLDHRIKPADERPTETEKAELQSELASQFRFNRKNRPVC